MEEYYDISKDTETKVRLHHILTKHEWDTTYGAALTTLPRFYHNHPWIDMLPQDYPDRYKVIDKYLEMSYSTLYFKPSYSPHWPNWRHATYLFITDQYKNKTMTYPEMVDLLDRMALREREWTKKYQNYYKEKLSLPHFDPLP